jgi:formylglycine-generating enzyme required for sulfatase activity
MSHPNHHSPAPMAVPVFTIQRTPQVIQTFPEDLGNGIHLPMVLIPPGEFVMGAPANELDSRNDERPQHLVTIAHPFFMSQCPITQAQWQALMGKNPAHFTGDLDLPVDSVSWQDAQKFCQRLSAKTQRSYGLPSEAQWEYACRAGTTTPFHFGKTIDAEIANYRAADRNIRGNIYSGKYAQGVSGLFRQQTTPIGSMGVSNAFGLYDMHGNVWEWCEDDWHDDYEGAPTDGSAWITSTSNQDSTKILRGGSWFNDPKRCRSACRGRLDIDSDDNCISFRVVYAPDRTS